MSVSSPVDLSELYATTTRHLLTRRYTLATSSLTQLLGSLPTPSSSSSLHSSSTTASSWSDLGADLITRWDAVDPWTIKSLKLAMTVYVSMFLTAKEGRLENVDDQVGRIIRDGSSKALIKHILVICLKHISLSSVEEQPLSEMDISQLPPSLIITLTLASLKINTLESISSTRDVLETWLGQIPDEVIHLWSSGTSKRSTTTTTDLSSSQISTSSSNSSQPSPSKPTSSIQDHKSTYHSLIELYILQLLPRMGDWEIAMDWLGNDQSLGSRRKEYLVRKLHAIKTKADERAISSTSPSTSNPTTTTTTTNNRPPSRRNSTSSSSSESEMTARPIGAKPIFHGGVGGRSGRQQKLKVDRGSVGDEEMMTPRFKEIGKEGDKERFGEVEKKKKEVEQGVTPAASSGSGRAPLTPPSSEGFIGLRERIVAFLSSRNRRAAIIQDRIVATSSTPRGLMAKVADLVLGRPIGSLMILLIVLLGVRRAILANRRHKTSTSPVSKSLTDLQTVQSRIRDRLRRRTDWGAWIQGWIWIVWRKVKEMVIMGTKITYV